MTDEKLSYSSLMNARCYMDLIISALMRHDCMKDIVETQGYDFNGYIEPMIVAFCQEEAWNYGTSLNFNIPIGEKNLELNAEYYYTDFINQMVVNVGDNAIVFENLRKTKDNVYGAVLKDGKSYSHTLQVDASAPRFSARLRMPLAR